MDEQKRYITIVSCQYYLFECEYDVKQLIAKSITNWVEVDQKQFEEIQQGVALLNQKGTNKSPWYVLVEKFPNQEDIFFKTIQAFKKHVKLVKEEEDRRIKEKELKRLEKQKRNQEKELKMKQKLFEQLKKELGDSTVITLEEVKKEDSG